MSRMLGVIIHCPLCGKPHAAHEGVAMMGHSILFDEEGHYCKLGPTEGAIIEALSNADGPMYKSQLKEAVYAGGIEPDSDSLAVMLSRLNRLSSKLYSVNLWISNLGLRGSDEGFYALIRRDERLKSRDGKWELPA